MPEEKELAEKEKLLASKEKAILLREKEVDRLNEELKYKEEEIKKLKEPLAYKEDELLRREEELLYKEKLLSTEKRKFEEAKMEGISGEGAELKKRLEELQQRINEKEAEIIKKEKYLNAIKEFEIREQGVINYTELKKEIDEGKEYANKAVDCAKNVRTELNNLERELIVKRQERETLEARLEYKDDMKRKAGLEELQRKINEKEQEILLKEKYLNAKSEELRFREQDIIEEEIETKEEERALEIEVEKVKTGNPRLDDLLLGGIPFGSNVIVYGQAFIGKEVIVNQFVAEGLKKGIPALWILTDKTPADIREEMEFMISGYQEYEKLGLVKYVDAYSKSMDEKTEDPYTVYIDQPTDHRHILKVVDTIAEELMQKHKYYRLGFRSISTLIAYLGSNITFNFLRPLLGRRKRDRAVSMYLLEKGMHSEEDINTVGSIMDGALEFKLEQLQTFLCAKGIGDVESRAWIRYTHSKKGINIGSFGLGHIK